MASDYVNHQSIVMTEHLKDIIASYSMDFECKENRTSEQRSHIVYMHMKVNIKTLAKEFNIGKRMKWQGIDYINFIEKHVKAVYIGRSSHNPEYSAMMSEEPITRTESESSSRQRQSLLQHKPDMELKKKKQSSA